MATASLRTANWYPAGVDAQSGNALVLEDGTSQGQIIVTTGIAGIEAPSWSVELSRQPGVGGARFQRAVRDVRAITVPVFLSGDTRSEYRQVKNQLIRAINPEGGPGILELADGVGDESGTSRRISAVYAGGLEGNEATPAISGGLLGWLVDIKFTGLDHWYSSDPLHATWRGKSYTPFFHSGSFLPFVFTAALYGVDEDVELEVRGDADTWPSYDLVGPFSRVRVTNLRSQRLGNVQPDSFWELNRVTSDTELLRLVTKPGEESLRLYNFTLDGAGQRILDAGMNAWSTLSADSWFDPLQAEDALSVVADGTFTGTLVELWAQEAWLSHG